MTAYSPVSAVAPDGVGRGPDTLHAWRRHGFLLAVLFVAWAMIFARDGVALVTLWWTNTTFGHCLFIAPVIGWLVWQRRAGLAVQEPAIWLPGLVLVALGGASWLVGNAAGVALARHLGMLLTAQGLVVTMLGPQVARALAFPMAYALFLVPFGESVAGPLQTITVAITMKLLALAGVPAHVEGVLITSPAGYFAIAEACSGSKFVIAMAAFATLVGNVCFVSWPRRIAFFVMAEAVAILANGVRAFGTIYAASLTSVETATGFDHIIFGWVFFGIVMAAVLAIGWRWFDRDPDAAWFDPAALGARPVIRVDALVGAGLALLVMLAPPAAARLIDARVDQLPPRIDLPSVPGWQRAVLSKRAPWVPNYPGADHFLIGRYADAAGDQVDIAVAVYGSQHDGKELVGFGIGPVRENDRWVEVAGLPAISGGQAIRITAPGPVERVVVTWFRIGDVITASDKRVKLETLRARLLGGRQRAIALNLSAEVQPGHDPQQAITRFLTAIGPLDVFVDKVASAGASGATN